MELVSIDIYLQNLLPSTLCYSFLMFAFIIVCIFLHYPKQHVFDVAIKRLSHAVSQHGFSFNWKKKANISVFQTV